MRRTDYAVLEQKGDEMFERFAQAWCQQMHSNVTWPINGKYRCRRCKRVYRVPWEGLPRPAEYGDPNLRNGGVPVRVSLAHQV